MGLLDIVIWGIVLFLVIGIGTWILKKIVKIAIKTAFTYVMVVVLGLALIVYYGNIIFGTG